MSAEHHRQASEILGRALELTDGERRRFVAVACVDDLDLRREVDSLLSHASRAVPILDCPLVRSARRQRERIGPYRLLGMIGEGGMGTVYRVRRLDGRGSTAALKVIRPGKLGGSTLDRFRTEQEILASLDHGSIVRILDRGFADDGLPYFVMELVPGQPIDTYCDSRCLGVQERLNVFLEVTRAVGYVHQRHIVHRDLKPANIFVTGKGKVKLIDFGIAMMLRGTPGAPPSGQDPTAMTPLYASPEQIEGRPFTAASDVYTLGVTLYQLLTGKLPYPSRQPITMEVQRQDLRSGFDRILMKALCKEPEKRYRSVVQLDDDLRHLKPLCPSSCHFS